MDIAADLNLIVRADGEISRPVIVVAYGGSLIRLGQDAESLTPLVVCVACDA